MKFMCYRGAVEHLGRQQDDLREIENSQMQDCLWLFVQDVPCVQKNTHAKLEHRFPVAAADAHMCLFSDRDISNRNSVLQVDMAIYSTTYVLVIHFPPFLLLHGRFAVKESL